MIQKKFLKTEQISDIKGLNFRPGKIIGSGYKTTQYNVPLYRKFRPKKKLYFAEDFIKNSFFLDIHRWRTQKEIDEELKILEITSQQINKSDN